MATHDIRENHDRVAASCRTGKEAPGPHQSSSGNSRNTQRRPVLHSSLSRLK